MYVGGSRGLMVSYFQSGRIMRLLTLNSLKSPLKAVNLGYPMGIEITEMEVFVITLFDKCF